MRFAPTTYIVTCPARPGRDLYRPEGVRASLPDHASPRLSDGNPWSKATLLGAEATGS